MQDHPDLRNDSYLAGKSKQRTYKTLRVWTKSEEKFEKSQENFEIFLSKSLWQIDFSPNFLLHISWSSSSTLKPYTPG